MGLESLEFSTEQWLETLFPRHDRELVILDSHPDQPAWISLGKDEKLTFWMLVEDETPRDSGSHVVSIRAVSIRLDSSLIDYPRQLVWLHDDRAKQGDNHVVVFPLTLLIGTNDGELWKITISQSLQVTKSVFFRFVDEKITGIWLSRAERYLLVRTDRQMYLLALDENCHVMSRTVLEELGAETKESLEIIWHPTKASFMSIVDGGNPKAWEVLKQQDSLTVLPHGALGDVFHVIPRAKARLFNGMLVRRNASELRVLHWGTHTIESRALVVEEGDRSLFGGSITDLTWHVLQELDDDNVIALVSSKEAKNSLLFVQLQFVVDNGKIVLTPVTIVQLPTTLVGSVLAMDMNKSLQSLLLGMSDGSMNIVPLSGVVDLVSNDGIFDGDKTAPLLSWSIVFNPRLQEPEAILPSPDGKWLAVKDLSKILLLPTSDVMNMPQHFNAFNVGVRKQESSKQVQWAIILFPISTEPSSLILAWHPSGERMFLADSKSIFDVTITGTLSPSLNPQNLSFPRVQFHSRVELKGVVKQLQCDFAGELLFVQHESAITVISVSEQRQELKPLVKHNFKTVVKCVTWHQNAHLLSVALENYVIQVYKIDASKNRLKKLDEFTIQSEWFVNPMKDLKWYPHDLVLVGCDAIGHLLTWRWNTTHQHLEFLGKADRRIHPKLGIHLQLLGGHGQFHREIRTVCFTSKDHGDLANLNLSMFLLTQRGLQLAKEEEIRNLLEDIPIDAAFDLQESRVLYVLSSNTIVPLLLQYSGRPTRLGSWPHQPRRILACAVRQDAIPMRLAIHENGQIVVDVINSLAGTMEERRAGVTSLQLRPSSTFFRDRRATVTWHPSSRLFAISFGNALVIGEAHEDSVAQEPLSIRIELVLEKELEESIRHVQWHPTQSLALITTSSGSFRVFDVSDRLDDATRAQMEEEIRFWHVKSLVFASETVLCGITRDGILIKGELKPSVITFSGVLHGQSALSLSPFSSNDGDGPIKLKDGRLHACIATNAEQMPQFFLVASTPTTLELLQVRQDGKVISSVSLESSTLRRIFKVKGVYITEQQCLLLAMLSAEQFFQVIAMKNDEEVVIVYKERISSRDVNTIDFAFLDGQKLWVSNGKWSKIVSLASFFRN